MGIYPPPQLGQLRRRDVPDGSIASLVRCPSHVRLSSDSDRLADIASGRFRAIRYRLTMSVLCRYISHRYQIDEPLKRREGPEKSNYRSLKIW